MIVPTIRPDISTQIFEYTTIQERSTFLTLITIILVKSFIVNLPYPKILDSLEKTCLDKYSSLFGPPISDEE